MAQAKARASTKRTGGTKKAPARSRGSSSRSRNAAGKSRGSTGKSKSTGRSNGAARVDSARRAVEHTAKDAGSAVGRIASKARVPLMTGGAALVGAAGGLALGTRQARRHRKMGIVIPRRPQVKVKSRDVAKAAKEVGAFGAQMGHLASELQSAREANGGSNRSPIEVVLEGLTARRSRA